GKGGNVVTFLMELEQMSYPEALRWIAKKYNIEIPEERPQTPEEIAAGNLKEGVYLISDVAAKWYVQQLHETDQGKAIGLSYFKERGFTDETIKKFHLGYSPEQSSAFADYALASSYSEQSLESSGISMRNERGWYDRFRGRVMFPIHSISGRVLGFGGRILQSNAKAAKYLNSPENPIYHKSKVLYGLFQAKQEIVKRDEALLVEGYTDVLSFYQNGVQNVVSSSGTALTEGQIAMLKRYTPNITLLYDGDAAGIRASFRGLDMMLEQGVNVRVVPFPDGEDPDSFAQAHSTEELEKYIKSNRRDFISFKTGVLIDDAAGDPLKRAQMVREIVASIAKVPDRIGQEVFVKEAARLLDIDAAALFDELYRLLNDQSRQARRKQQQEPPMEVVTGGVPEEAKILGYEQEKTLIHLAISKGTEIMLEEGIDPEEVNPVTVADWIKQELDNDGITFQVPVFAKVYGLLCAELEEGEVPVTSWWVRQPDPEVVELVTEALTEKYTLAKWEAREIYLPKEKNIIFSLVRDTVFRFKYMHVQRQLELLKSKLDGDDIQIDHYMNEFSKWNQLRQMLDDELNRVV
ncbi:DNA primase, partial [Schleiferiaceae bacterium]|nr:DNA primase [Schleiferiaceae bacterium]